MSGGWAEVVFLFRVRGVFWFWGYHAQSNMVEVESSASLLMAGLILLHWRNYLVFVGFDKLINLDGSFVDFLVKLGDRLFFFIHLQIGFVGVLGLGEV